MKRQLGFKRHSFLLFFHTDCTFYSVSKMYKNYFYRTNFCTYFRAETEPMFWISWSHMISSKIFVSVRLETEHVYRTLLIYTHNFTDTTFSYNKCKYSFVRREYSEQISQSCTIADRKCAHFAALQNELRVNFPVHFRSIQTHFCYWLTFYGRKGGGKDLKGHGNKNFVFQFFHGLASPEPLTLFKFDLKYENIFVFFIRCFC